VATDQLMATFSALFSAITTDWQMLHRYFIADLSNHCALGGVEYGAML